MAKNHDLRPYELSTADWTSILLITKWLKSFCSATTQMSTTKSPMLSTTHAIFRGLQEDLRQLLTELPDSSPSYLKNSLIKAHQKLSDYYTKLDDSPFYIWASCISLCTPLYLTLTFFDAVLDPRISYQGLLADCTGDPLLVSQLELVNGQLTMGYQEQYMQDIPALVPSWPAVMATSTSSTSPQKVNFMARYKQWPRLMADELSDYFKLPQGDFDACNPLAWWAGRQSQFPNLSWFACDLLSMPGKLLLMILFEITQCSDDATSFARFCCCYRANILRWLQYHFPSQGMFETWDYLHSHVGQATSAPHSRSCQRHCWMLNCQIIHITYILILYKSFYIHIYYRIDNQAGHIAIAPVYCPFEPHAHAEWPLSF